MCYFKTLLEPGGLFLARHLHRLCNHLQLQTARLKESVASTVGQSVAGVVREIVHQLLGEHDGQEKPFSPYHESDDPFRESWHPESPHHIDDCRDEELWINESQPISSSAELGSPSLGSAMIQPNLISPISIGFQTFWYLRQNRQKVSSITAIACGVAIAIISSGCIPIVVAGTGLLSTLGLINSILNH